MEEKTHYRKVYKTDHLGVADIEEMIEEKKRLVFTIKEVRQEIQTKVAGKNIDANIAYFKENIKPLVLNPTNSKVIKSFNGNSPFIQDWSNTIIEFYYDSEVKFGKETTGGIRIMPTQPKTTKPELSPESSRWEDAKKAVRIDKRTRKMIEKNWIISDKNWDLLCG